MEAPIFRFPRSRAAIISIWRALKEGAAGTLTVVFNRKTYILYLVQDNAKAFAAVNFTGGSGGGPEVVGRSGGVTPARLLSLIDMAKAYDLLMQRYPTELRDTKRSTAKAVFQFEKFRLELLEVIRFHHEDTLVFKVLLHNDTDEEILYDKFSFSVQAGNRTYPMSAADATGVMPPAECHLCVLHRHRYAGGTPEQSGSG